MRSWKNAAALVNRIPPEILALIPDFIDTFKRDQSVVALTHVCRAWREVFTSRSTLWTCLDYSSTDKTRVYLERSKSSPLALSLCRNDTLSPRDPLFQITPQAIGRLKSLSLLGTPRNLEDITTQLSLPAPLLEVVTIEGGRWRREDPDSVIAPTLFNGDLSSLDELRLQRVVTKLHWRNMTNLTTLTLVDVPVATSDLLDFFRSAPHLREVEIHHATLAYGARPGQLVSLAYLKRMEIFGDRSSVLLDHLLVPVGAWLMTCVNLLATPTGAPPKFLNNLKNLRNFATIELRPSSEDTSYPYMEFSGPNGKVKMILVTPRPDETCLLLESLALFNTSEVEQLDIDCGDSPPSGPPYQALLPMGNLHTLTLTDCDTPHFFIHALDPTMSPSGVMACPRLEKLVVDHKETLDIKSFIRMAAARVSRGVKLKFVRICSSWFVTTMYPEHDVSELKKHVFRVECSNSGGSDEED